MDSLVEHHEVVIVTHPPHLPVAGQTSEHSVRQLCLGPPSNQLVVQEVTLTRGGEDQEHAVPPSTEQLNAL